MKLFWIWPSIWPYEASIWSVPLFHHQGELNLMVMGVVSGMRVLIWAARSKPETGVTGLTSLDPWWLPGIGAAWLSSSLDIASTNPLTWVISHLLAEMRQPASRFRLNWKTKMRYKWRTDMIWLGYDADSMVIVDGDIMGYTTNDLIFGCVWSGVYFPKDHQTTGTSWNLRVP